MKKRNSKKRSWGIKLFAAAAVLGLLLLYSSMDGSEDTEYARRRFIIPGRVSDRGITLRIIPFSDEKGVVVCWPEGGGSTAPEAMSISYTASAEAPADVVISGLQPSTRYLYRVGDLKGSFHTARKPGESFTFAVQTDSHLLNKADPDLYHRTVDLIASGEPDLLFDLGDTFLNDKLDQADEASVEACYRQQLPYMDRATENTPLFLVIGNHEGEYGYLKDGTEDTLPVLSARQRTRFFPNPVPDDFYTGNSREEVHIGLPQNYYAFTWGDALFVALDPYRYTMSNPAETMDVWDWTLGDGQYRWLEQVLEESTAPYKFVLVHHVVGNVRGASLALQKGEWAGAVPPAETSTAESPADDILTDDILTDAEAKKTPTDVNPAASTGAAERAFARNRPLWERPVGRLLEETGVTMVLQGHDHLYAREKIGSVVYQTVPKAAETIPDRECNLDSYPEAECLLNSGYLEIEVSPGGVRVDYLRTYIAGSGEADFGEADIPASYRITQEGEIVVLKETDDSAAFEAYISYEGEKMGPPRNPPARNARHSHTAQTQKESGTEPPPSGGLSGGIVMGRPSSTSIALSCLFDTGGECVIAYGTDPDSPDRRSEPVAVEAGIPVTVSLEDLDPGTEYFYRVLQPESSGSGRFVTMRPSREPFIFLIEADPHLDENSDGAAYDEVLEVMTRQKADFIVDLGDSSMAEKLANNEEEVRWRYRLLRSYWDNIGNRMPVFMVMGNHDGENGRLSSKGHPGRDFVADLRRSWFPNPLPGTIPGYSGLSDTVYAFEWGDALIIVLDPYLYTTDKPKNNWDFTLGEAQYRWLSEVLEKSSATHRFVFIHHLVGGQEEHNRGGADLAPFYEWGGYSPQGEYLFSEKRPGWEMPIHDLLIRGGVDVVFHGHDHFFALEEKDGIIYQLVPQPSPARIKDVTGDAEEYGYSEGVFLSSPGFLRISVAPEEVIVDFLQGAEGKIAYSYLLPAGGPPKWYFPPD